MNKKGLAWNTIVTATIVLIVLVTLIWIFREQIGEIVSKFSGVTEQVTGSTKGFTEDLKKIVPE
jgi:preprotein translocase subunit SecG